MRIPVPVKRVVDINVKVRVKSEGGRVEIANVKRSMNEHLRRDRRRRGDAIAGEGRSQRGPRGALWRHTMAGNPAHRDRLRWMWRKRHCCRLAHLRPRQQRPRGFREQARRSAAMGKALASLLRHCETGTA